MSYSCGGSGRSATRSWPLNEQPTRARAPLLTTAERTKSFPSGSPAGSPATSPRGQEEKRAVEDAIKTIQRHIDDVQRETRNLVTANSRVVGKVKVDEAMQSARTTRDEATRLLEGLTSKGSGCAISKDHHKRMMIQKLTVDMEGAWTGLEVACRSYFTALSERERRQNTVVVSAGPRSGATRPGGPGVELLAVEADAGQQLQQLKQLDVGDGELEVHTAIVDEYVTEIRDLEHNIRSLQGAMVDLAQHSSSQGDVLDNIESNMARASEATGGATEQLTQASTHHRRGTKLIFWIVCLAAILSVLVVVVVVRRNSR